MQDSKECACSAGDAGYVGLIPALGKSLGGGKWQPTAVFLREEPHGQRSLVGCSPKGHKQSDMTERLCMHTYALIYSICFPLSDVLHFL